MVPAPMSATEVLSLWTEVRPSHRHERVSEVRERVIQEGLQIFDRETFTIGRKIGEGGQGTIYEGTSYAGFSNPLSVVVKKFKPLEGISQGQCLPQFWALHFINVCKPLGFFFDHDDCLCMFMPRYSTDLRTLIDSQVRVRGAPFPEQVAVGFITKIAMSLKILHGYGIYHRDIKAANILVDTRLKPPAVPEIYISDFESSADVVGTGFWRAPEILQTLDVFSEDRAPLSGKQLQAADVYGFAMTCYEILTGESPFGDHRWSDYNLVLSGGRPELPDHVPEPLKNLIRKCWHQNPDARPSFAEIISLLQESYDFAGFIVSLLEMAAMQAEASTKWLDAPPEACLVELTRTLLPSHELHTIGLDIFPAFAKLQQMIADFISTSEEFVSEFGWDSHLRHPSLPFIRYVERRRLVTLMQHLIKLSSDVSFALEDGLQHHQDRLIESTTHAQALLSLAMLDAHRTQLVWRIKNSISEGEAESEFSESESLTYPEKFAIVKTFINSLLDAGVSRAMTLDAVARIDNRLYALEGASYGKVRFKFLWKWYCMTKFHPFYDVVAEFLDAAYSQLFSYETLLLYLGYKISAVSGLSDLLLVYTRYSMSGFHEVLLRYLLLRVDSVFAPFFRCYTMLEFCGWKGILWVAVIRIIFLAWVY